MDTSRKPEWVQIIEDIARVRGYEIELTQRERPQNVISFTLEKNDRESGYSSMSYKIHKDVPLELLEMAQHRIKMRIEQMDSNPFGDIAPPEVKAIDRADKIP